MVIHVNHGVRGGGAAQHSHSPQAMLWNTPGHQDHAAVVRPRCARPAPDRGRGRQPGVLGRPRQAVRLHRSGSRRAGGDPVRRRRHQAAGHRRHDRGHLATWSSARSRRPRSGGGGHLGRGRRPAHARATRPATRSSARWRGPGASSSSTSAIAAVASAPSSPRWSPSTRSTSLAGPDPPGSDAGRARSVHPAAGGLCRTLRAADRRSRHGGRGMTPR